MGAWVEGLHIKEGKTQEHRQQCGDCPGGGVGEGEEHRGVKW